LIPESEAGVLARDRVKAEIVVRGRGRHFAQIVEILDRRVARHLGIFRRAGNACFVELEAPPVRSGPRARSPRELLIPPDDTMGAEDGQLVEVEARAPKKAATTPTDDRPKGKKHAAPRTPEPIQTGRVTAILGRPGARATEMKRLFIEYDLPEHFPAPVEAEAAAFGSEPTSADHAGRKDLRHLPLCTIDGETAKDFDDAVCAVKEGDRYRLYVAIADVSHYVRPGTALDQEAIRRGTSTYLTDRAIPMLPEALSNGLCSLKPNVDRLCVVAEMELDATGRILRKNFLPGGDALPGPADLHPGGQGPGGRARRGVPGAVADLTLAREDRGSAARATAEAGRHRSGSARAPAGLRRQRRADRLAAASRGTTLTD
jgi:ribonuclease R